MTFLGITWGVISSSANLISGARQMATRVGEMVQSGENLREEDRRRLLRVQRRVECLIQPLNFCIMVSQRRGSSHCDAVIQSVSDLIQNVCDSLRKAPETVASSFGGGAGGDGDSFSELLDNFLEELDFAAISLNMVISTAPYMTTSTTATSSDGNSKTSATTSKHVKAAAGRTGVRREFSDPRYSPKKQATDGVVVPDRRTGCFSPTALLRASRRIRQLDPNAEGAVLTCGGRLFTQFQHSFNEMNDLSGEGEAKWGLAMGDARFSIVREKSSGGGSIMGSSGGGMELSISIEQPGAAEPFTFPITVALQIELRKVDGLQKGHTDEPALVWTSTPQAVSTDQEDVIDDIIVLGPDSPQQSPRDDPPATSFAFVFHDDPNFANCRDADGRNWNATDVLYLSRLCVLENGCQSVDLDYAHISATDEVLWTLFRGI